MGKKLNVWGRPMPGPSPELVAEARQWVKPGYVDQLVNEVRKYKSQRLLRSDGDAILRGVVKRIASEQALDRDAWRQAIRDFRPGDALPDSVRKATRALKKELRANRERSRIVGTGQTPKAGSHRSY